MLFDLTVANLGLWIKDTSDLNTNFKHFSKTISTVTNIFNLIEVELNYLQLLV